MTGGYVGSILAGLTSDKTYHSFVRIGFVDANGVGIPVGGAEGRSGGAVFGRVWHETILWDNNIQEVNKF